MTHKRRDKRGAAEAYMIEEEPLMGGEDIRDEELRATCSASLYESARNW
jgi:hypothetical protein